jgi:fructose-1,6-bisphosphatase
MIPTARRYLAVMVVMEDVHMAKGGVFVYGIGW